MRIFTLFTSTIFFCLTFNTLSLAQGGTYFVDFENVSGNQYSLNTYNINGLQWESLEGLIGSSTSDVKLDAKSLRLRRNGGINGYFKTIQNYTEGLGALSFYYSRANFANDRTGNAPKLEVAYSIDSGLIWTALDTIDFSGIDSLHFYQSEFVNILQPIQIKLEVISGDNGKRINIDDLTIQNAYSNISIQSVLPQGYGISAGSNQLQIVFSEAIALGDSGKVYLNEVNGALQSFDVSSNNISIINDSIAVIDNILLAAEKDYIVLFDSTIFKSTALDLLSTGIYDSTIWNFATYIQTVKEFYDPFDDCNDGMIGDFYTENIIGDAQWDCDLYFFGNAPPFARIMGGTTSSSSDNEDYLIYALPVLIKDTDLDNQKILLEFDEKRRYEGDLVQRSVLFSTDYNGNATNANWQKIDKDFNELVIENKWQNTIWDITSIIPKNVPFHLAFKYKSETTTTPTAYEWCIDNVKLYRSDSPVANIKYSNSTNSSLTILGNPNKEIISALIDLKHSDNFRIALYDINGKVVYQSFLHFNSGENYFTLAQLGIQAGMYMLRASNQKYALNAKVIVTDY